MSIYIKNHFFNILSIILLFKIIQTKTLFIPFRQHPIYSSQSYDKTKFLIENTSPKFVSNISIGTPAKIIPTIFNIYDYYSSIKPNEEYKDIGNNNYEIYEPNKSSTYENISLDENTYMKFNAYTLIKEKIKLCNDIKCLTYEEINDFFIYIRNNQLNAFSYIDISSNDKNIFIMNQLKEKKIIKNSIMSIKYTDDYSGYYIIGDYPHIYDKENFSKEQLITYNLEISGGKNFDVLINKVFISWNEQNDGSSNPNYKEKKISLVNGISFNINLNLIIASEEYMNLVKDVFFNEYFNKKICDYNIIPIPGRSYKIYTCIKSDEFNIKNFPSLKFNFYGNNYVYELTYEDLFIEKNNIYYFLVSCDYHINENWKLGKPFLKKYQLIFDGTKKLVGYYNQNIKSSNISTTNTTSKSKKIIFIFIIANLVIIPIVFFLAKRRYMRKKYNANELNSFFVSDKKKNENENENSMNIEIGLIK